MLSLIRILAIACFGGILATVLWWITRTSGMAASVPEIAKIPLWLAVLVGGMLGAIRESLRILTEGRRERMNRELAANHGLEFAEQMETKELRSWSGISIFHKDAVQGLNRIAGRLGDLPIEVFDLSYTETSQGSENSTTTKYVQTVYRFPEATQGRPRFRVQPRWKLTGLLSSLFGTTELELSPPEDAGSELISAFTKFRKKYQLIPDESADVSEIRQMFHPLTVGWLSLHPGWMIESNGTDLVVWKRDVILAGEDRLRVLNQFSDFLTLISGSDLIQKHSTQVAIHDHDRARGLAGFLGLWGGMMLGLASGGMLTAIVLSEVFAAKPELTPSFPFVIPLFFGSSIAFAVLWGFLGLRFGQKSAWAHRFAQRMDFLRGCVSASEVSRRRQNQEDSARLLQESDPTERLVVPTDFSGTYPFDSRNRTWNVDVSSLNSGVLLSTPLPPRVTIEDECLTLEMTRGVRLLGTVMGIAGIIGLTLATMGIIQNWPKQAILVSLLCGLTTCFAGVLMLLLPTKHIFDRTAGTHSRKSWISSTSRPLNEIVAVQVAFGGVHSSDSDAGRGSGMRCYQLNLVLNGSPCKRVNLANIPDQHWIEKSAGKLAQFLNVPVIDAVEMGTARL